MRVLDKLIIKLYSIYNFLIYPRLRHIRGATRLKSLLRKIGEVGYEGVDENSVQLVKDLEWDNLIILDSCRYDIYSEIREAENIEKRLSGGSSTVEFIKNNFSEPYDSDLVYVTAVYNHIDPGRFRKLTGKKMDEVFAGVYDSSNYGWNEDYLTTTPEGVLKAALEASEEYPGAKKIIHFRQPHYPFLDYDFDTDISILDVERGTKSINGKKINQITHLGYMNIVTDEELLGAYRANLKLVLPYLSKVNEELEGKTLVTSDHGELLSGDPFYGHYTGSKLPKLREVPLEEL